MKLSWLSKARYFTAAAATVATVSCLMMATPSIAATNQAKSASPAPSWWSTYDHSDDALVSGATAAKWVKNGYKTASGDPVVILDIQTDFTESGDRIIGSTSYVDIDSYAVYDTRAEGPIDTTKTTSGMLEKSSRMVLKGATIDSMIQDLGITKDTVLVLTTKGAPINNETRLWWTFYYWGFSESKIKILDGGVAAVKAADPSVVNTTAQSVNPADSTFSVKDLPGLHDVARASTKDVIDLVKAGKAKIIDVRGAKISGSAIDGRIKNAIYSSVDSFAVNDITTDDGTFIPKATALAAVKKASSSAIDEDLRKILSSVKPTDTIVVHCFTGISASPIYYYLKEVMKYPHVILYDGSWSAWSSYTGYEAVEPDYDNSGSPALTWNGTKFVDNTGKDQSSLVKAGGILGASAANQAILAYDTVKLSKDFKFAATTNWKDSSGVLLLTVDSSYKGDGNEIEDADKAYIGARQH